MPNDAEAYRVDSFDNVKEFATTHGFCVSLCHRRDPRGRTYGRRLNGDFFLLSSFPFEHDCPHGTRQHDAIGAVKPLSPLDSRGTVHRRRGARNCGSYCRVISGSITDGGFNVLGNGLQVLRRAEESAGKSNQGGTTSWRYRQAAQRSQ